MARRMTGGVAIVALALALLLAPSVSEAQGQKGKRLGNPGDAIPAPPSVQSGPRRKAAPKPPDYLQGGPTIAPQGQAGPGQVANSLRARGFNSIGPVQQRGNTLITEAVDPNGTRVQLVVTPNGQIIGIRPLGPRSR